MQTIQLSAGSAYGQSGHYIAQITGRNPKYTFERAFVGHSSDARSKSHLVDEPGLFQICDIDKKGRKAEYFRLIVADPATGELVEVRATREEAMALAKLLDAGESLIVGETIACDLSDPTRTAITVIPAGERRKARAAATVDAAIAAVLTAIDALPFREQKKVLAEAKKRITPPKAVEAQAEAQTAADSESVNS